MKIKSLIAALAVTSLAGYAVAQTQPAPAAPVAPVAPAVVAVPAPAATPAKAADKKAMHKTAAKKVNKVSKRKLAKHKKPAAQ